MRPQESLERWEERAAAAAARGLLATSDAMENRLLAWRKDPGVAIFPLTATFEIQGGLDRDRLAKAWAGVVARHRILRLRPVLGEDGGVWLREAEPPAMRFDGQDRDLRGTDPFRDSLVDAHCRPVAEGHLLRLQISHLLVDAYSMTLVVKELAARYNDPSADLGEATDFTTWAAEEREYLRSAEAEEDADWWRGALNRDSARQSVLTGLERGASHEVRRALPDELAGQVRRAEENRVTGYSLMLTALAATLRGDRSEAGLVVTTSFGRRLTMADYATVGCLTSRTLIPVQSVGVASLDAVAGVQRQLWEALEHSRLPYAWIRHAAWPDRGNLLDADPEVPYFALNETWKGGLVLEGLETRGVERRSVRSADTFELWVEQLPTGYELTTRGPYAEGTLRALQDEVVERLGATFG